MKNILLISILFLFCNCNQQNHTYEIFGLLPSDIYNGELIYLVPFENASPEIVDSTRIINGKFNFKGNDEKVRILRLRPQLRLAIQELIVITEPGTIYVHADSISSAYGTPQNEILQGWKNNVTQIQKESKLINQRLKKTNHKADSLKLLSWKDSLIAKQQDYNYQILQQNDSNTVGKFIYRMTYHSLRKEQKKSLSKLSD